MQTTSRQRTSDGKGLAIGSIVTTESGKLYRVDFFYNDDDSRAATSFLATQMRAGRKYGPCRRLQFAKVVRGY